MNSHDYHKLGNSLQESGEFNDAVAAYRKAVELNPDFSWSHHSLGDVLLKLERWEDAVAAYKKAVELNPDFSWSYHNLGDALLKLECWENAVAAYRCEIALNSDFAWSFYNLANALTKLKEWDEAIVAYLKAIQIDGNLPGIYEKLGYALGQTKSDSKSLSQQFQLQVTPENLQFYLQLGKNLAKRDRPKSATIIYQTILTIIPDCGVSSADLERLLQEQQKCVSEAIECDRALASARATVAQKPDDCWSYYNLGAVLSQQKYGEEAAAAFLQAMAINPDLPWWFYYNLWEVLIQQNKLDRVENFCREVVDAQPEAFWPYLNLGEVLTRQGKIAEAISCYQTVSYKQIFASVINKRTSNVAVAENTETGKMPVPQNMETGKMPVPQNTETGKMPVPQNWNLKPVKFPKFIIIGSQRCGTTSLYTYLAEHPQILSPIKKEMDFFSWHFHRGIDWYWAHFPLMPPGEEFVTGEASPSYFDFREAPERLYSACPEAKLIVLLRNPVDRAISHFYRLKGLNWEGRSLDRAISDEIERLNQNPEYIIGEEPGNYLARGRYIEFIKNWLAFFPREQLLVLQSEDLYAGAAATVQQVLAFLDLPEYQLSEYQNANPGSYQRVNESVRELLSDYFKPYNQELEEYLGRKFDWK
ncbi:tetratricopeptide repeat-containing sulfotransferase family protein [Microcoleus sp. PH2017_05_CCC_O_A]|uniref:tetratricopeptide repeat-containing sulfotransferase family protein n=1 Tax=Microcoleus sp. PH2017_05_CCC_O_A TaxID=2798816 RepID=UPI001D549905|nr:tetratricopeptide repeat-containing sulfotransferase family protein [Microcoleus sp. PH2017_05_CCC_O_A]MCC3434709.1 tetratricopeptide repeat protein [Microcoleus sp. PH2017_05_CCC_O_A]